MPPCHNYVIIECSKQALRCDDVDDSVFMIFINLGEVRAQPISIADMANLRFDISNFNNRPSHTSLEGV